MKHQLIVVINTLCGLFANKAELRGFSDWDQFVGCIVELQKIANSIPDQKPEEEVTDDGNTNG